MRKNKKLLTICFLFIAASLPAHATSITYVITFTTLSGSPAPASGSFTYDDNPTSPLFSDFRVSWNGGTFDLTSSANAPSINPACRRASSAPAFSFALLSIGLRSDVCSDPIGYEWSAAAFPDTASAFPPTFAFELVTNFQLGRRAAVIGTVPVPPYPHPVAEATGHWSIAPAPVPEPSTALLIATGLLALIGAKAKLL